MGVHPSFFGQGPICFFIPLMSRLPRTRSPDKYDSVPLFYFALPAIFSCKPLVTLVFRVHKPMVLLLLSDFPAKMSEFFFPSPPPLLSFLIPREVEQQVKSPLF